MPTSNAQRQAAYRARHLQSDDGEGVRLNLIIGTHAKCALERLAGASNGFDPDGDPTRRAAAVRAWRAWLAAAPR